MYTQRVKGKETVSLSEETKEWRIYLAISQSEDAEKLAVSRQIFTNPPFTKVLTSSPPFGMKYLFNRNFI